MLQTGEPNELGVHIVVIRVHDESSLAVGKRFEARHFPLMLGRSLDADLPLGDVTVSRAHARIEVGGDRLVVEAISHRAKVWLNKNRIAPGERVPLPAGTAYLQLGGVLLEVNTSPATAPYIGTMTPPDDAPPPLFLVEKLDSAVRVIVGDRPLRLHRGPTHVLWALAKRPNEPVADSTILLANEDEPDRALGRNLNQMVTYARNAIAEVLDEDATIREELVAAMREAAAARGDDAAVATLDKPRRSSRELTRLLVRNQRNFGYMLGLLPEAVDAGASAVQDRKVSISSVK